MMSWYVSLSRLWRGAGLLGCLALAICVGCGGGDDSREYHVSGTVTYGGDPVQDGIIIFEPDASQRNVGPAGSATIKDGKFDTRNDGKPTIGGPHLVKISASASGIDEAGLPQGKPPFQEKVLEVDLPEENSKQDFEVPE